MSGVLAGLEDGSGVDLRRCEYFVGTSAGSIVAARLAAGLAPRRPAAGSAEGDTSSLREDSAAAGTGMAQRAAAWAMALGSPLLGPALVLSAPSGALARAALLRSFDPPTRSLHELRTEIEGLDVGFDGRLRVVAVARDTGRRVVFGRPASPIATVGQAVEASCTVPWLFAPVTIAGREYVDGGAWSPTNLDVAPAGRGSHVLCLSPTAGLAGTGRWITLARRTSKTVTSVEAAVLRARGANVIVVGPDATSMAAIGADLMATQPRARVHLAGYRQGLVQAARPGRGRPPARPQPARSLGATPG